MQQQQCLADSDIAQAGKRTGLALRQGGLRKGGEVVVYDFDGQQFYKFAQDGLRSDVTSSELFGVALITASRKALLLSCAAAIASGKASMTSFRTAVGWLPLLYQGF